MPAFKLSDVKKIHIELSSLCNAECPLCPRNLNGYPYNDGYVERNLSLTEVQKIFPQQFLQQIDVVLINGNFGDFVMNPESLDIIEYFSSCNPHTEIRVSTNGGARNQEFWQSLARYNTWVSFCIDGLEDTHSLYRRNTQFHTVIKNAKTYINAGGAAQWKMILFDHNRHQAQAARLMSEELGFKHFYTTDVGRNTGPVYDKNGDWIYDIGGPTGAPQKIHKVIENISRKGTINLDSYGSGSQTTIDCEVLNDRSIYVASTGDIYPCCYHGLAPKSFGSTGWYRAANSQIAELARENNALEYDLEHCMVWFEKVSRTWQQKSFASGRLLWCDNICSAKSQVQS